MPFCIGKTDRHIVAIRAHPEIGFAGRPTETRLEQWHIFEGVITNLIASC